MATPPSGTITFLFSDIEGSTQLWEQHPERMAPALAQHDALMRAAIEQHHGYVIKTAGDGFCAAFSTAPDALAAALAAQRALLSTDERRPQTEDDTHPTGDRQDAAVVRLPSSVSSEAAVGRRPSAVVLRVRMGLNSGSAEERDNDYFGTTVNRVARIMALAHGGQMLLSSATAELLSGHLPLGVTLREMGEHRLKGLINPERLWQVVAPDLPSVFPPLASLNAIRTNLPVQLTSFVGREQQVAEVKRLIADDAGNGTPARLVTIIGPGGAGKTRLSLQVAAEVLDAYKDGVWFVELAPVGDADMVPATIARVLGFSESLGSQLRADLFDFVREKRMLLVLDNFEQVIEAAGFIKDLLTAAPSVRIIVSSRALLRIPGEHSYELPLLSLPDRRHLPPPAQLTQYEAVRLFFERARAVKPDFGIDEDNAPAIAEICYQLDGLPLAIELAAARVRLLPPQKMIAPLSNRLKFLTGSTRGLPARQQTLRGAIDWSHDLLKADEQALFRRLSLFVGGATLEAIEAVCNGSADLDVLAGVESLLDKSLLRQSEAHGEPRFWMLEMLREYAAEKLGASAEAVQIASAHLDYYLALAEQTEAHQYHYGPERTAWFERLLDDYDNVLAALDWAMAHNPECALRLAGSALLASIWTRLADVKVGREQLEATFALINAQPASGTTATGHVRALAIAHTALGIHAFGQGDLTAGRAQMELGAAGFSALGDEQRLAFVLSMLGLSILLLGDVPLAKSILQESIALCRRLGNTWVLSRSLNFMGVATILWNGEYAEARAYLEEGLDIARRAGDKANMADAMMNLGQVATRSGDYALGRAQYTGALELFREQGVAMFQTMSRSGLADVARKEGDYAASLDLYREVITSWQRIGNRGAIARILECMAFMAWRQPTSSNASNAEGLQRAARLFGAAEALREESGSPMNSDERAEYEREIADLRAAWAVIPEVSIEVAWNAGRAMSMAQAVAYATETPKAQFPSPK